MEKRRISHSGGWWGLRNKYTHGYTHTRVTSYWEVTMCVYISHTHTFHHFLKVCLRKVWLYFFFGQKFVPTLYSPSLTLLLAISWIATRWQSLHSDWEDRCWKRQPAFSCSERGSRLGVWVEWPLMESLGRCGCGFSRESPGWKLVFWDSRTGLALHHHLLPFTSWGLLYATYYPTTTEEASITKVCVLVNRLFYEGFRQCQA